MRSGALLTITISTLIGPIARADHAYFYHKTRIPLALANNRIVCIPATDDERCLSEIRKLAPFSESAVSSKWHRCIEIDIHAKRQDAREIKRLIENLANSDAIRMASPVFETPEGGQIVPTTDLFVAFKSGTTLEVAETTIQQRCPGATIEPDWTGMQDVYRVRNVCKDGRDVLEKSVELAQLENVRFAEPDMIVTESSNLVPNDEFFGLQWALQNCGQNIAGQGNAIAGNDLDIPRAWDYSTGDPNIIIVVLDTGIQLDHPDLVVGFGADLTGAGTNGAPANNCERHGTSVGGIIRSTISNAIGVAGVAPTCQLGSARYSTADVVACDESGTFYVSDFVDALDWAQTIGARVTNLSASFGGTSATIDQKYADTRAAGIVHFVSAGNTNGGPVSYPARLTTVNAVASVNKSGRASDFGAVGPEIDFSAPGELIATTDRSGVLGYVDGDYVYFGGTSASSAFAAGVAALLLSMNPALTVDQIEQSMRDMAIDLGDVGQDDVFGAGLVRACCLVTATNRLYVDLNAVGLETGASWQDAFRDLQSALKVARANPGTVSEIWVAEGLYRPSCDPIELADGVTIYGGFVGTESLLSERSPTLHPTIITSEIDDETSANYVFRARNLSNGYGLDGLIVKGGRLDQGLDSVGCDCSIRNCVFDDVDELFFSDGNVGIESSLIISCGGLALVNTTSAIANCTIAYGFSLDLRDSSLITQNSIYWGNSDRFGVRQIVADVDSSVAVSNCLVHNGEAGIGGAGTITWGNGNIALDPLLTLRGRLRQGSPCVDAGAGIVPAYDIDGESRTSDVAPDIGCDEFVDSDLDGLPDWFESIYLESTDPLSDADIDGVSAIEEYELFGTNPEGSVVYVDNSNNGGPWDGTANNPYGNIGDASNQAVDGDTVIVRPGIYGTLEDLESDLDGKTVLVTSSDGAEVTVIDGTAQGEACTGATWGANVRGFKFQNFSCAPYGRWVTANCIYVNNDTAIIGYRKRVRLSNVEFLDNTSNLELTAGFLVLENATNIVNGSQYLDNVFIDGAGQLVIESDAVLQVGVDQLPEVFNRIGAPPRNGPVILRSGLSGTGVVEIKAAGSLLLFDGAVVDLSGVASSDDCVFSESSAWGTLIVEGSLVGYGGLIQRCNIDILLGEFEESNTIENNDIRLLETAAGYGGEFFVSGDITVRCNAITSEGDRYLDLDPDPTISPRPTIIDNRFFVRIKQGVTGDQGELLELRTEDFDLVVGGGYSGAYELANSVGYDDTWVLEQLEVLPNAKVNLTNRPGFVFQDPQVSEFEALYVKRLKLHSGAVLNTSLHRLYYQTLVDENDNPLGLPDENGYLSNGARLTDVPLLGFSLKIIAMEDDTEFAVRVRPRLRDPDDDQPNGCVLSMSCLEGSILRITDPNDPSNSVMEMKTHADGMQSASSVSAHGAFARAGEDQIVVAFEYLFCGNASDELVVYLSDSPEAGENLVEVARIGPPAGGPGSIGSGEFAKFSGLFPRGSLNFRRGTYVELELIGEDACVLIDEWDPLACGSPECGDYDLSYFISNVDLLYGLTAMGNEVGDTNSCLDRVNRDNYVDVNDVILSDALYGYGVSNLCNGAGGSSTTAMTNAVSAPQDRLLISGKPNAGGDLGDRLYPVDASTAISDPSVAPPVDAGDPFYGPRGHGRLVQNGTGELYQLHSVLGLIRLSDGQVMVAPGEGSFNGDTVRLGMPATGSGLPMFDAAFDPNDATVVYVVPARIIPTGGEGHAYYAAAKLQLTENAGTVTWTVEQTYGYDPQLDPNNNTQPPQYSQTNVQYLREIEADASGNLYVTCARADNQNDWLLIYDSNGGTASEQRVRLSDLATPVRGPAALHVTDDGSKLYLGTSLDEGDPMTTKVQEFTLGGTTGAITVTPSRVIEVGDMRFVTAIAEDENGTVYVVGYTAPVLDPASIQFNENDSLFTTATLAVIPPTGTSTTATTITGADAALPISAVFTPGNSTCLLGDVDGSGTIDIADIQVFVSVLLNGPNDADQACRADANEDQVLNGNDVFGFVESLVGG